MLPDTLSTLQLLAPTLYVIGAIYLLGPMLPLARTWARLTVFGVVGLIAIRYLYWRLFSTVLPADGEWYEVGWIWFCYGVELFAIFDASILYVTFMKFSDRRGEADIHEARLRTMPVEEFPSVDVYIPTYNETEDVLEKTITGCLCLDYPNYRIWVLDDGRRSWLKTFCDEKGVGYITRDDNAHAKAGNINAALKKTNADYVAIFDADFIPQQNFLMRTMGFFEDPKIGIVQIPHSFYNHDPMQTNLALRKSMPDDQRFFFESIMPSRDAWDAAFCCGSNSVTRRAAFRAVGDALPTGSITEDMLLTLAMLRVGYITRYLCEPLAFGLAPESLKAFFVQRQRWARGATQILMLEEGPLMGKLSFKHRLMFMPTHWLSQSLMLQMTMIMPIVFLWTGILPFVNMTFDAAIYYMVPMLLATTGGISVVSPGKYSPLASQVLGTFQSFKIVPTVLMTLIKPFGHVFKVTPKGVSAQESTYEQGIFIAAGSLILLTVGGAIFNSVPEWRIIEPDASLATVILWGGINVIVLFLVCMLSLQAPSYRTEERFEIPEQIWAIGPGGVLTEGHTKDISLSGTAVQLDRAMEFGTGDRMRFYIIEVGFVEARVIRQSGNILAAEFILPTSVERDLLIRKLFTLGLNTRYVEASSMEVMGAMLRSIVAARSIKPVIESIEAFSNAPQEEPKAEPEERAAQNLLIQPRQQQKRLAELSEERKSFAA